jgi:hypothetical protein
MRNSTVSLTFIAEYLFRTLSFIPCIINAFPIPTVGKSGQISQNITPATTTNSTISALKITQNTPSQNVKLRVKLWTLLQPQQKSPVKFAWSTASQP